MDPITLLFGVVSLGSAVYSLIKQGDENDKAKAAAAAQIDSAKKQAEADRHLGDAKYLTLLVNAEAEVARQKTKTLQLAQARAQLEKRIFVLIALLALGGAVFITLKNKSL